MDIKVITGADPAAGAEVLETVPADKFWRLLGVRVVLVADANVANRLPALYLDNGTVEFARIPAPQVVTNGQTKRFTWAEALNSTGWATPASDFVGPLPRLILPPGYRVGTQTENLQVGDNFSAPVLYVAEFDSLTQALTAL